MARVTQADVARAEAALADAKTSSRSATSRGKSGQSPHREQAENLAALRSAWREQEQAAGNRRGLVGGDAFITGMDCDVCGETFPPDEVEHHTMIAHMSGRN